MFATNRKSLARRAAGKEIWIFGDGAKIDIFDRGFENLAAFHKLVALALIEAHGLACHVIVLDHDLMVKSSAT